MSRLALFVPTLSVTFRNIARLGEAWLATSFETPSIISACITGAAQLTNAFY